MGAIDPVNRVFGRGAAFAAGDDLWGGSAVYPFPAAAAATNIISGSANDTAAGTGARTVRVAGVVAGFGFAQETVALNGVTQVVLANSYLRILEVEIVTVGSGGVAAGAIDVRHTATVLATILAGEMQAYVGVWTVPNLASFPASGGYRGTTPVVRGWVAQSPNSNVTLDVQLLARAPGGVWRLLDAFATPSSTVDMVRPLEPWPLSIGTDLRIHFFGASAAAAVLGTIEVGWISGVA